MSVSPLTSPSAGRVLQHADDARPAWLWSGDGQTLLWHNESAALFLAKLKKHGLKRAPVAVPIKGQVARNIRLGTVGRTSLARIQFLAGDKPASSTCATTPLAWDADQVVLLIVAVDPVPAAIIAAAADEHDAVEASPAAPVESQADSQALPVDRPVVAVDQPVAAVDEPMVADAALVNEPVSASDEPETAPAVPEIAEPETTPGVEETGVADQELPLPVPEPEDLAVINRLSRLVDRLAADESLYAPLDADPEDDAARLVTPADNAGASESQGDADTDLADDLARSAHAAQDNPRLFKIVGRRITIGADTTAAEEPSAAPPEDGPDEALEIGSDGVDDPAIAVAATAAEEPQGDDIAADAGERRAEDLAPTASDEDAVERVSRYNFDELSRILTERVGEGRSAPRDIVPVEDSKGGGGALINLGGETLVLNRLPLGILVFRDQQILFANRAITEMVGYGSVEQLRTAGLAAVFPASGPDGQEAGPVNHLVQQNGNLVPVTARLQSISWQGRPALMLSASTTEVRTGHEAAVRAFAQSFAELRGDGFFEANRSGVVSAMSGEAAALVGRPRERLEGTSLVTLVTPGDVEALQEFLERPARFAETARPCLTVRASHGGAEIILFAHGQAGVVSGYFGFVHNRDAGPPRLAGPVEPDSSLLSRISRSVRRPLNTIIGFSDLIRSHMFGSLEDDRYRGYAQDIAAAGQEIAALVDELDDYARLRDGRYQPQRASIELTALLEGCVVRIRNQANMARVIVRNGISEHLPRVTADRASLAQAVLNLLSSAIDQSPAGGAVVISAQRTREGGIAIQVRDSSNSPVDLAERFVVFRDGQDGQGRAVAPIRSSVGLALTRSLLAVNTVTLEVNPAGEQGMLFTLTIPPDLVDKPVDSGAAQ